MREADREHHEQEERQSFDGGRERDQEPLLALPRMGREELEDRRVPQEVPEDGGSGEQRRGTEPLTPWPAVASGDECPDRHPDQAGVQHVGVEAARDHAYEEPLEHAADVTTEHGDEVEDVLDDGEAEPAERAVDEAVHHVVDLVTSDQHDQHDAEPLEDLLHERSRERRRPSRGELGPTHARDHHTPPGVADRRQRGGGHRSPDERGDQQRDRFPLVEIEEVDEHGDRGGVDDHEPPRQEPAARRHLAEEVLLPDRHDAGQHHDDHVQPEGREAWLEEPLVMQRRVREHAPTHHQATSAPSIIAVSSSTISSSCPWNAQPSKITPLPAGETATVTDPSTGDPLRGSDPM